MRRLPAHVAKHSPVALELFSGSGRWAQAWRSRHRRPGDADVFEFDIRWHLGNDLLLRRVRRKVRGWIRGGLICAVWLGTPCNSFSIARDQPWGTAHPLRTNEEPYGLSDPRPSDAEKVRTGNVLAQFSLGVFEDCTAARIPATVENPSTRRLATTRLRLKNRPVCAAAATDATAAATGTGGYGHGQPPPALAAN